MGCKIKCIQYSFFNGTLMWIVNGIFKNWKKKWKKKTLKKNVYTGLLVPGLIFLN